MGDHPHMAQVLPLGTPPLAVTRALPVQNIQASLRLLCAGLHHDEGSTLPDRFDIRTHLAVGDPEVEEPTPEALRALQRAPGLEVEVLRRWEGRMGGSQRNARTGKPLLHEVMHDRFSLGQ